MKRNMLLTLAGLLIAAGSAYAQNIRVDVPFQFSVGETVMPAGAYFIEWSSSTRGTQSNYHLRSMNRTSGFSFVVKSHIETSAALNTKVVFHCYSGGECFLFQIRSEGHIRELFVSRKEHLLANNGPASHVSALVALR